MKNFRDGLAKNWPLYLVYIAISHFIIIEFGQNLLESGSFERKYFYFSGMSWNRFIFALVLYKVYKNDVTKFLMWLFASNIINNMVFFGQYSYIEFSVIIIGAIILSLK